MTGTASTTAVPGQQQATQQPVLTPLTGSAIFLVLVIEPGGEEAVRGLLADLAGLQRAVGFRYPPGGLACVAGIGSDAWDRLFAGPRPTALHPLPVFEGEQHQSVSTPGDLLFHLRAEQMFLCFELAAQITERLTGAARVVDEVHGFKYWDQRDLLGFVDGTENPVGTAADVAVTVTASQDAEFAGASYVVVQKYLHDLTGWNALPVEEQERVIGRTKLADIELSDDVKPAGSHVAANTITGPDGTERQILRDNMPFGDLASGERGTYFIGYTADPAVTEEMLNNMFVGGPTAGPDRILDFSTAVTGTLFVVPTADFLEHQPSTPTAASPPSVARGGATTKAPVGSADIDRTLGIGSLKS